MTARGGMVPAWGRVQYEKGFQVLARAMSTLRTRVPDLQKEGGRTYAFRFLEKNESETAFRRGRDRAKAFVASLMQRL